MNSEQRAIIALAEKEGVSPIEKDARLIVHGMVNATREQMRKYQVGYDKMGEAQQDAVLGDLTRVYEELAITIARALASASTPSVIMTCKDLKVSNGTFTAIVESDQTHYNDLISKVQDKGEIVAVLYERQYRDGMETIQADRDQKSLPLGDDDQKPEPKGKAKAERAGSATSAAKLAAKAIELPPKLVEDGRKFLIKQQIPKAAALQNALTIGFQKAEALLKKYEEEGLIEFVGTDAEGEYRMVREKLEGQALSSTTSAGAEVVDFHEEPLTFDGEDDGQPLVNGELTEELYDRIKTKVIADAQFSAGGLSVTFDLDDEVLQQATDRLEMEGIITEENELGVRLMATAE